MLKLLSAQRETRFLRFVPEVVRQSCCIVGPLRLAVKVFLLSLISWNWSF